MGFGSYTSADWSKLKTSKSISASSSASQIFTSRSIDAKFDPKYINKREAMDSEEHPDSTPIIIGLDVTGSMGYLSEEIAKNALNETMMKLYSTKPVNDPQLMFAAIGDVTDNAPLQVTQFESDIRIAEQLLALWLEGNGGDGPEDFSLLWYFAAKHTKIDSYEKRGKKGFLFTIGDADVHERVTEASFERIFSDKFPTTDSKDLLKLAQEKYEVFHIHIVKNTYEPQVFTKLLPGHLIKVNKDDISKLPEIIISTMQLVNGASLDETVAQWSEMARPIVKHALSNVVVKKEKRGFFF